MEIKRKRQRQPQQHLKSERKIRKIPLNNLSGILQIVVENIKHCT